jgi:hypothetical protein
MATDSPQTQASCIIRMPVRFVHVTKKQFKEIIQKMDTQPALDESGCYQIRVKGILDPKWSDWFDDFTIF